MIISLFLETKAVVILKSITLIFCKQKVHNYVVGFLVMAEFHFDETKRIAVTFEAIPHDPIPVRSTSTSFVLTI